jgi:hypothetical protein
MKTDGDVWKYYEDDLVAPGSPSRVQYFWAAHILSEWLPEKTGLPLPEAVLQAHGWPAVDFTCF